MQGDKTNNVGLQMPRRNTAAPLLLPTQKWGLSRCTTTFSILSPANRQNNQTSRSFADGEAYGEEKQETRTTKNDAEKNMRATAKLAPGNRVLKHSSTNRQGRALTHQPVAHGAAALDVHGDPTAVDLASIRPLVGQPHVVLVFVLHERVPAWCDATDASWLAQIHTHRHQFQNHTVVPRTHLGCLCICESKKRNNITRGRIRQKREHAGTPMTTPRSKTGTREKEHHHLFL